MWAIHAAPSTSFTTVPVGRVHRFWETFSLLPAGTSHEVPTMATQQSERLLTTAEAATALGLKPCTLNQWRYLRKGPPYREHGKRVFYSAADLTAWSAANRVDPASAGDGGKAGAL